jgi:hypothetical protein
MTTQFQEIRSESFEIAAIPVSRQDGVESSLPLDRPLTVHRGDMIAMSDKFRVVTWLDIPNPRKDDFENEHVPATLKIPDMIEVGIRVIRAGSKRARPKTHWRYGKFAEVTNVTK